MVSETCFLASRSPYKCVLLWQFLWYYSLRDRSVPMHSIISKVQQIVSILLCTTLHHQPQFSVCICFVNHSIQFYVCMETVSSFSSMRSPFAGADCSDIWNQFSCCQVTNVVSPLWQLLCILLLQYNSTELMGMSFFVGTRNTNYHSIILANLVESTRFITFCYH
jgi:hypothetical protein